jgi:dihydrofolate reductase
MGRIVAVENVSLDGVMQAPGRADEDTRHGFAQGGWARPYMDEVAGKVMAAGMGTTGALLLGRRTYEQFFDFWPKQTDGNPFTEVLNRTTKYVVSRTLTGPLPWQNSALVGGDTHGDAATAVADLKQRVDGDLCVLGSGELVRALTAHGLVDALTLAIHPLVLGTGTRLFPPAGPPARMTLVESVPTTTGVIIATYEVIR